MDAVFRMSTFPVKNDPKSAGLLSTDALSTESSVMRHKQQTHHALKTGIFPKTYRTTLNTHRDIVKKTIS